MGGRGSNISSVSASNILNNNINGGFSQQPLGQINSQQVTQLNVDDVSPQIVSNAITAQKNNNNAFKDTDNADYHQLYNGKQYYANQSLSVDQRVAVMNYLSDVPEPNSLYSVSQNMNYNLSNNLPLNANQQYTYNYMKQSMHNLGYNLSLQRYDHADFINGLLNKAGINKGYDTLSESALKKALVGGSYQTKSFTSTSYNNFVNAPSTNPFSSRAVKIEYSAKAKTQAMMPGNGNGGKLGEIVLSNSNTYKITDVKFDGRKARAKGTQSYTAKGVTIYIDVE